ncbi:hypothetical protein Dda_1965 [Drechslerella dactyloides]|uniref:F-box domain-containing protein n=1 Tax=Drechslerella dactyloides TaxID=74499 RepID=A0AAD6J427_DREDA|nr:hypothetical protein Dda_1965 [Drechslerella dactyloides]
MPCESHRDGILSQRNPRRISLSRDIPLDIKLQILESLDTVDGLRSLLFTCHAFYDISQTHLWNRIYRTVLENDIGPVGRTLVKLLRFGAGKTLEEIATILPTKDDDNHESAPGYLDDLISVRQTVRFLTRAFLEEMFYEEMTGPRGCEAVAESDIAALMLTISPSEYARVEKAYYTLWTFLELHRVDRRTNPGLSPQYHEAMNKWTIWNEDGSARFDTDIGLLHLVQDITGHRLICRYRDACRLRMKRLVITKPQPNDCCPDNPIRNGLIENMGFQEIEALLRLSERERREIVLGFTRERHLRRHTGMYGWREGNFTEQQSILLSWWRHMMHSRYMDRRRLWRKPHGMYIPVYPPWEQIDPDFNLAAIMWDDDRLAAWGYFKPRNQAQDANSSWCRG